MTKKCVQCGKSFTITDSEIKFYKSKNLTIPKRCSHCREENRGAKGTSKKSQKPKVYDSYYVKKPLSVKKLSPLLVALIAVIASLFTDSSDEIRFTALTVFVGLLITFMVSSFKGRVYIQEFDTSVYKYTFYNTDSMVEHYIKHGKETNCNSMEKYLRKANLVITNKTSTSKRQKEDNDVMYYNKKTDEFVVVAQAGYIRTYFIANEKYYNKQ